jgi:predicted PurR-regulated permease PerM
VDPLDPPAQLPPADPRFAAAEVDPAVDPARSPLLRTLLKLPLKKLAIWAGLFALLVLLADFFPLIFMTFVLSYIASSVVGKIEHRFSARWVPVVIFFSLVVAGVVGFVRITVPQVTSELRDVTAEMKRHRNWNEFLDGKLREGLGKETYDSLNDQFGVSLHDEKTGVALSGSHSLSAGIIEKIPHEKQRDSLAKLGAIGAGVWKGIVYVFLTIIFSLMLVWGLPDFKKGIRSLETSRFSDVYLEVAPSLKQFGRLLGRAFEAQTAIAACNTLITFAGMRLIGIPGSFLLSVIVFVCSFIPVAGVFISTAPIALTGLLMEGGSVGKFVAVVVMVTVAHIIEAYILNPRIYGHHMKMNPLAVLVILVIAEHTVGVWGLVIAIPLSTYIWRHVILGEGDDEENPPARKPEPVSAAIAVPS